MNTTSCHAGEALSTNPDLLLEDWSAFYVPGPLLQTLGGLFTANDDVDLPDGSGLMTSPTASTPKQVSIRLRNRVLDVPCRHAFSHDARVAKPVA